MVSATLVIQCPTAPAQTNAAEISDQDVGPIFDEFRLTLRPGARTEIAGPLYYHQEAEGYTSWGFPPLFSRTENEELESLEVDFLYPLMTYDRYGKQYRWQFGQLFSLAGGESQTETNRDRFTIFPIYWQQRSTDSNENYTAFLPFYGDIKYRFGRDIHFVAFPLYVRTVKRGVTTWNMPYPLFHLREGPGLKGWQLWPLAGHELKEITTITNRFGDLQPVAGHERWTFLWPIFADQRTMLGTPNPTWEQLCLPFYYLQRSRDRDQTTLLWPFFSRIDDRRLRYREWQTPWPFIVNSRGPGKNGSRVWPFYNVVEGTNKVMRSYLWPIYRYDHTVSKPLDRHRTRLVYFLYNDVLEKNTETGQFRTRRDLLPFFTYRRERNGGTRLQVLAILEPILPSNRGIERNFSPIWSLWRDERSPATGARSQSLLWNLYRRETTPDGSRTSFLFGLFQHRQTPEGSRTKLLFVPVSNRTLEAGTSLPQQPH